MARQARGLSPRQRQEAIVERLTVQGRISVQELVEAFRTSTMTIRRDLEALEQRGVIRRVHGGATLVTTPQIVPSVAARLSAHRAEKEAIGRAAVRRIEAGDTVLIDAGSTTYLMVHQFPWGWDVTLVTNSLDVAAECLQRGIQAVMLGGVLVPITSSAVGPLTVEALKGLRVNKAFLGASSVSPEHGFSNDDLFEVDVKRQMIAAASEVTVLADSSKFGRASLASFASFSQVHRVITDTGAPAEIVDALRAAGVSVELVAPANGRQAQ